MQADCVIVLVLSWHRNPHKLQRSENADVTEESALIWLTHAI